MVNQMKNKGGKRVGAGRKPLHPLLKKVQMPVKLPRWLIDRLNQEPVSRAVAIELALCRQNQWLPPDVVYKGDLNE